MRLRHQRNKATVGRIVPSHLLTYYNGDLLGDCSKWLRFRNQLSPGKVVKITGEGDSLMEQGPDDPKPEADLPMSANSFFQHEQPGVLIFTRSPDGKPYHRTSDIVYLNAETLGWDWGVHSCRPR